MYCVIRDCLDEAMIRLSHCRTVLELEQLLRDWKWAMKKIDEALWK